MKIDEFIGLFDEKAIADGKVAFTFHEDKSGKWNFWAESNEPSPKEHLMKSVMEYKDLADRDIDGFQTVALEPWGENGIRVRIIF